MAAAVFGIEHFVPGGGLERLTVSVLGGMLSYGATIMLLWRLIGYPDGPEKTLWHIMRRVRRVGPIGRVISAELEMGAGVVHGPGKLPPRGTAG